MKMDRAFITRQMLRNKVAEQAAEIERLVADRDSWMQQASERVADAVALVAAERERWEVPVRALLAAHDASLRLFGKQMRQQGITTLRIQDYTREEIAAISELMALVGA